MTGRRTLVAVGLVVAVVVLALGRTATTFAYFTDQATTDSGSFTAGTLNAAVATAPTQADATSKLVLSWSRATLTTGGSGTATAKSYDVVEYSAQTGGSVVGTVCSGVTTTTCTFTATRAKAFYGVTARFESWTKASTRVTFADTLGPVASFTSPDDDSRTYYSTLRSTVASDCGPGEIACGVASDSPGVASVQYTLRRTGAISNPACWTGSSWTAATSCTFASAAGTTSWAVPGSPSTAYTSRTVFGGDWTYVLTVRVTDTAGNLTTITQTYSSWG